MPNEIPRARTHIIKGPLLYPY